MGCTMPALLSVVLGQHMHRSGSEPQVHSRRTKICRAYSVTLIHGTQNQLWLDEAPVLLEYF